MRHFASQLLQHAQHIRDATDMIVVPMRKHNICDSKGDRPLILGYVQVSTQDAF